MKTAPRYALHRSDLGWIGAARSERGLAYLTLPAEEPGPILEEIERHCGRDLAEDPAALAAVFDYVDDFLAGEAPTFDEPLDLIGTPFQVEVWRALLSIPRGTTVTYGDVARQIGRPRGARPVGQAVGTNPVPIIVPCHRVLASGGKIGGYGGGLAMKRRLLALEGVTLPL